MFTDEPIIPIVAAALVVIVIFIRIRSRSRLSRSETKPSTAKSARGGSRLLRRSPFRTREMRQLLEKLKTQSGESDPHFQILQLINKRLSNLDERLRKLEEEARRESIRRRGYEKP